VTGRRGRRRRKLPGDLKERGWNSLLKEEALDRTMWRARFGRGFGPVMRQTTKWMNSDLIAPFYGVFISAIWSFYFVVLPMFHKLISCIFVFSVTAYILREHNF
jgi:hypothetical protein